MTPLAQGEPPDLGVTSAAPVQISENQDSLDADPQEFSFQHTIDEVEEREEREDRERDQGHQEQEDEEEEDRDHEVMTAGSKSPGKPALRHIGDVPFLRVDGSSMD